MPSCGKVRAVYQRLRLFYWRRYVRVLGALTLVLVMLSGCMEALQGESGSGEAPPSALPTIPETALPSGETPVVLEATTTPLAALTPTDIPTPTISYTPLSLETATTTIEQASPTPEPTFALPTLQPITNEQRWRAQQINRVVLDPQRVYTTSSSELWWYDPINQQSVIIGTFAGNFTVQAQFTLRGQGIDALEVPYQVNKSYGLTALSPAIVARIATAGNAEWIETYVFVTPNIVSR